VLWRGEGGLPSGILQKATGAFHASNPSLFQKAIVTDVEGVMPAPLFDLDNRSAVFSCIANLIVDCKAIMAPGRGGGSVFACVDAAS
jgi:hypothetical protein